MCSEHPENLMKKLKLVMIGNGMAGVRTLEELLKLSNELYDITVFGAEPHTNYNRIMLSPVLANEQTIDDIILNSREWYAENNITLYTSARVTGTQRVVDHAGRDDEMAYQEMLAGLELKRDIEYNLVGLSTAKVTGATTTARKFASVNAWITTNTDKGGGTAADPTAADGTSARVDSATLSAFTEARLKNVIKKCFDAGGKPTVVMLNSFNKQQFSTFTGRGTPMQDQGERKITAAVDVYESDFGRLKVTPNRFMRQRDAFVLQMDMWATAPLPGRSMVSFPLAKTGDSDAKVILSEMTLESRNEKASGGVFDLTTA